MKYSMIEERARKINSKKAAARLLGLDKSTLNADYHYKGQYWEYSVSNYEFLEKLCDETNDYQNLRIIIYIVTLVNSQSSSTSHKKDILEKYKFLEMSYNEYYSDFLNELNKPFSRINGWLPSNSLLELYSGIHGGMYITVNHLEAIANMSIDSKNLMEIYLQSIDLSIIKNSRHHEILSCLYHNVINPIIKSRAMNGGINGIPEKRILDYRNHRLSQGVLDNTLYIKNDIIEDVYLNNNMVEGKLFSSHPFLKARKGEKISYYLPPNFMEFLQLFQHIMKRRKFFEGEFKDSLVYDDVSLEFLDFLSYFMVRYANDPIEFSGDREFIENLLIMGEDCPVSMSQELYRMFQFMLNFNDSIPIEWQWELTAGSIFDDEQ